MSEAWKHLDLQGQGVQSANLKLARLMKRRRSAYLLWLLAFPLGQHRAYLNHSRGAWGYRLASFSMLFTLALEWHLSAAALAFALAAWALYDLFWIDSRVTLLNKQLRMGVYLHQGSGVPPGFQGRFGADAEASAAAGLADYQRAKEAERPGHGAADSPHFSGRVASFAEQEALLRALQQAKHQPPES